MRLIYVITNTKTSKKYIGQTKTTLKKRWQAHLCEALSIRPKKQLLHKAIKKYGKDEFTIEVLDFANTQEESNLKEIYFIKKYSTLAPQGYNLTLGGIRASAEKVKKTVYSIDIAGKIEEYNSMAAASRKIGRSHGAVHNAIKKQQRCANKFWARDIESLKLYKFIKIKVFNRLNGKLLGEWNSVKQCAEALNLRERSLQAVLYGKRNFIGKYCCFFSNTPGSKILATLNKNRPKTLYSLNPKTKEVNYFFSQEAASKKLGIPSKSINKALRSGQLCKNLSFQYITSTKIPESEIVYE